MPAVHGCVDGLLHGTQQHRVDLQRIRPVFGGCGDLLKFTGCRVIADRHAKAKGLEVVA